jgi:hypothetical protein
MRWAAWVWLGFLPAFLAQTPDPRHDKVTLKGQAVLLAEVLKSRGVQADPDTLAKQVVLRAGDAAITPLLCDDASRALFLDEKLRGRPIEILGRRLSGLPYLQVTLFRIEDKGKLRIPEYYCDVCTISVRFPQVCPCCQGPMDLRMKPEAGGD